MYAGDLTFGDRPALIGRAINVRPIDVFIRFLFPPTPGRSSSSARQTVSFGLIDAPVSIGGRKVAAGQGRIRGIARLCLSAVLCFVM